MNFLQDKRTLDDFVQGKDALLGTLGKFREPTAAAFAALEQANQMPALAAARRWRGQKLRSMQEGITAAHLLEEMIQHKVTIFSRMLKGRFTSLQHSGSSMAIREIVTQYQRLQQLGALEYLPMRRFRSHDAQRDSLPYRRELLFWTNHNSDSVWQDIAACLRNDPVPYRTAGFARLSLERHDVSRALRALDPLIARLQTKFSMYVAPASIVAIPERWIPPVTRRYGMRADLYNLTNIGAPIAWQTSRGEGSSIAIIDTGADYTHAELSACFGSPRGYNFVDDTDDPMDDNEHGTHVCGTVAGKTRGVAPDAQLFSLKVLNAEGYGSMADVLRAMEWVMEYNQDNEKKICAVNLSLGSSDSNPIEARMCRELYESGVAICAAAGNEMRGPSYPAAYDGVISVAAVDRNNDHANFSNIWHTTDISAPGVDVNSCVPGGYAAFSGTSMATPHIAGVAALAYAIGWQPADFEKMLKQRAQNIGLGEDEHDGKYGAGLCRADRMVTYEMVCGL